MARRYEFDLPADLLDHLRCILSARSCMDTSYTKTAIGICRLYKKYGYLDLSKRQALNRISQYCGYYG